MSVRSSCALLTAGLVTATIAGPLSAQGAPEGGEASAHEGMVQEFRVE